MKKTLYLKWEEATLSLFAVMQILIKPPAAQSRADSNCGQSCIASKRFIVVKDIAKEFTEQFVRKTEQLKVGDPLVDDTDLGPVVINATTILKIYGRNCEKIIKGGSRASNRWKKD